MAKATGDIVGASQGFETTIAYKQVAKWLEDPTVRLI
jgi:hypothetical protein